MVSGYEGPHRESAGVGPSQRQRRNGSFCISPRRASLNIPWKVWRFSFGTVRQAGSIFRASLRNSGQISNSYSTLDGPRNTEELEGAGISVSHHTQVGAA